ncbi:MAG: protein kinase [Pirellulales bacterium]
MMHSTDKELQLLLLGDESTPESGSIAAHVEACDHCRNRMLELTGGIAWQSEVAAELKDVASWVSDSSDAPTITRIELHDGTAEVDAIELEPISLDFLGPPSHPELLGRLGRYDIERLIGSGGMGVVLKGHDGELHRSVAIKVLAPHLAHSAAARRRFAREAQAAAAVLHPNVIPIFNVESEGKLPYLVMQYISGPSLQARVDDLGPLSVQETLRIALQTAAGLFAAHAQGLVHRDVKPANILLEESVDRVILSDFGLARTVDDANLTRTGIVTGTPHYMSPEQASGELIDFRSDQFSLGCAMYFMLTGRPPFRATTAMGVLNRVCHEKHRPVQEINPEVPREVSQLIDRLLQKKATDRFASTEELTTTLGHMLAGLQSGKLRLRVVKPKRTRLIAIAAVPLLFLCVAMVVGWSYRLRLMDMIYPWKRVTDPSELFNSPDMAHSIWAQSAPSPWNAPNDNPWGTSYTSPPNGNTTQFVSPTKFPQPMHPVFQALQSDQSQWLRQIEQLKQALSQIEQPQNTYDAATWNIYQRQYDQSERDALETELRHLQEQLDPNSSTEIKR